MQSQSCQANPAKANVAKFNAAKPIANKPQLPKQIQFQQSNSINFSYAQAIYWLSYISMTNPTISKLVKVLNS